MKTFKYLLVTMIVALASVSAEAQLKQADNADYQFHSTSVWTSGSSNSSVIGSRATSSLVGNGSVSTLMSSGSRLPIAARNGVIVARTSPNDNSPAYMHGHIRREVGEGGFEDEEPEPDPMEDPQPIGDGVWVLMLLAIGYAGYMVYRRRKVAEA